MYAEEEAALLTETATDHTELASMLARRVSGVPLEQVLGWAEFLGQRIIVEPDVFVPRRRTEAVALEAIRVAGPAPLVLDLCCGSAALGTVLAARLPGAEVWAADVHPAAVHCARRNLAPYHATVVEGDLFAPLPHALRGRVDLLVVNAPYVPTEAIALMPPEAREHEPLVTLDGGPDGLAVHRRVAAGAAEWLPPGGRALIETSTSQAAASADAFASAGFQVTVLRDEARDATVTVATRTAP